MAHHTRSLSALLLSVAVALFTLVFAAEAAFEKGHVHLPLTRVGNRQSISGRDAGDSVAVPFKNNRLAYVANVQVGTPPQDMSLAITTTTGFSWLQDPQSGYCRPTTEYVYPDDNFNADPIIVEVPSRCQFGTYNKSLSSTYLNANQQYDSFSLSMFPGTSVYGKNMTDKLVLGDLEFPDMPMGLVSTGGDLFSGVLGLGGVDAADVWDDSYYYPRFIDRIVDDGHAITRAFSIWLDDAEGKSGHLLFGAIDKGFFEGELLRIQTRNPYAYHGTFGITVTGFEVASGTDSELEPVTTNDFPLGVTISPGEIFSYLPTVIFNKIADLTGAYYNSSTRITTIPCDAASTNNARFSFRLAGPDGPVINFETADLILPSDLFTQYDTYIRRPDGTCLAGIQYMEDYYSSYYNFGSSLLRRSYLVFDVENAEVAVAPVKFKSTGKSEPSSTVVAFASSGAPVPSADLYCGDSDCEQYCPGEGCSEPFPEPTSDPGDSGYPGDDYPGGNYPGGDYPGSGTGSDSGSNFAPSYGEESYWHSVAIGVGVSLGVVALVAGIAITIIWGRICRGGAYGAGKKNDDDSEDVGPVPASGPVMSHAGTAGTRMLVPPVVLPPGTLPVIKEEDPSSRAPQLPAVATTGPITPPEPRTPSNRNSIAVSAVSSEDGRVPEPVPAAGTTGSDPEAPKSPKGKGVERTDNHDA